MKTFSTLTVSLFLLATLLPGQTFSQPNIRSAKQGYSMRLNFDNRGVMGKYAYPGAPPDSIGLEYPIGAPYEHIYGAGLWLGGKLDTSRTGTGPQIKLVTTAYEGWAGPLTEFYPGSTPADSIWKVVGRNVPRPASWFPYWGNSIRSTSLSDNDHYCTYDDISQRVTGHIPLQLKIIQSSFVWNDPYAEAIHIIEYKIINMGEKQIDSAYVGMFLDADVGPYRVPNYNTRNFTDYYSSNRTAVSHNAVDSGSTPVGISILKTPRPMDSLRFSFLWYPGPQSPTNDAVKYAMLSSGTIRPSEFPDLSDTRFILSFGSFTLLPQNNPASDTLVIAVAVVSGYTISDLLLHATRAKNIYLSGGLLSVDSTNSEVTENFILFQNYPNPFNPSTRIRFALKTGGLTTLSIHDVLGREVTMLVNEELLPGVYEKTLDAAHLAGGVYFYSLNVGTFHATRKLILLK